MSKQSQQRRTEAAAAALREAQRRERRRSASIVAVIVLVVVAIIGGGYLINRSRTTTVTASPAGSSTYGVTIGPASAPHQVVIYEDFLCPFCGAFEKATHTQLAALAASGKVRVEYRPFDYLGDGKASSYSARAAGAFHVVLTGSGAEVAKSFHDLMFADQPSEAGPFPSDADLADLAEQAGASATVTADIQSEAGADWVVSATQAALATGLQGTPTVLLDGKEYVDGRTIDQLSANLLAAVG